MPGSSLKAWGAYLACSQEAYISFSHAVRRVLFSVLLTSVVHGRCLHSSSASMVPCPFRTCHGSYVGLRKVVAGMITSDCQHVFFGMFFC